MPLPSRPNLTYLAKGRGENDEPVRAFIEYPLTGYGPGARGITEYGIDPSKSPSLYVTVRLPDGQSNTVRFEDEIDYEHWQGQETFFVDSDSPTYEAMAPGGGGDGEGLAMAGGGNKQKDDDTQDDLDSANNTPASQTTTLRDQLKAETLRQLGDTRYDVPFFGSSRMRAIYGQLLKLWGSSPTAGKMLSALPVALRALQRPDLIADVIADIGAKFDSSDALAASGRGVNVETYALIKLVELYGVRVEPTVEFGESQSFYDTWVKSGIPFIDMPFAGDSDGHGASTHLIQDLVVSKAFKASGTVFKNAWEFREALGQLTTGIWFEQFVENKATGAWEPEYVEVELGEAIWRGLYDAVSRVDWPVNQPEVLFPRLKKVLQNLM